MAWKKDDIEKLIELYHSQTDLWDIENPNYSKKDYRLRSLELLKENLDNQYTENVIILANTFNSYDTLGKINTKIKHLRSYYAKELSKVRKSTKSGSGTDDVFKSKWPYFASLDAFLNAQITPRQSTSNLDSQTGDEEAEERDTEDTQIPKPKKHKSGPAAAMAEAVNVLSEIRTRFSQGTSRTEDTNTNEEDTVFGKYLTNELRKIRDPFLKNNVRLKLQTVIFEAQEQARSSPSLTTERQIWRPQVADNMSPQPTGIRRIFSLPSVHGNESNESSQ
ncbi:uncharacterized protein LOC128553672 [Mercenaria mercenaria]|uniref:uncharacterized protein LOC128553672 n=1 Tax=Mercenaria mercenaria TaxID=6596 RepID=UPI00234E6A8F|nr:uncharacterized protein LOC128553672 [Mercenaria mercenaria]